MVPVGEARHVLPLDAVRETFTLGAVAPLPGAPPAVLGAVNRHGDVLVVLDTGMLLGGGALDAPTHAAVVTGALGVAALAATGPPATAIADDATTLVDVDALLDPDRLTGA